jgi:hypothetical protein
MRNDRLTEDIAAVRQHVGKFFAALDLARTALMPSKSATNSPSSYW